MRTSAIFLLGALLRPNLFVAGDQDDRGHLRRRGLTTPGFDQDIHVNIPFQGSGSAGGIASSTPGFVQESNVNLPFQSRIIGGIPTSGTKYPFHVSLDACGGSLVAKDVVLSAAHCYEVDPSFVLIGGSTRTSGERVTVAGQGVPHPGYRARTQENDFLLYKLRSPSSATPVAINFEDSKPSSGETLTVIGFGATTEGGFGSNSLREVDVQYVPTTTCNVNYGNSVQDSVMFCAGVDGGGRDSCQGDSGGPIIDQNGALMGVTSWGNGCGLNGFPGVYARVSGVKDWLKENICAMSDFPPDFCGDNPSGGESNIDEGANNGDENTGDNGADEDGTTDDHDSDNAGGYNDGGDNGYVQPKGVNLKVVIETDDYPEESALLLYRAESNEALLWQDYGSITSPGLFTKTVEDLGQGTYVFLVYDNYFDGICCQYGRGKLRVYETYAPELGIPDQLRWSHNGRFRKQTGASFRVTDDDRRGLETGSRIEFDDSFDPYDE